MKKVPLGFKSPVIKALIGVTAFVSFMASAEIAVIVHPSNANAIDKAAIEGIFMGKRNKYDDGKVAIPINGLKESPTRDSFNEKVIGRNSSQVNAYWAKLVFTGKGTMPQELANDAEIISTVAQNEGAISYVDASSVNSTVKVVATY
ncbi:phosphate ABC transporter substrate-binding protein [Aliiglaciecola sp. CAU 1673]|uniref:phosphate ABC transporter substrate-binding protein n=1 Tax=Aliiglaciecola sp. CAU 1673 TaxID=3032595 RepID=UPI0023D98723|nr:phosphate ABC transporter substrate-binding protein [Aliiglaciecola sp. CAU 1673]MDF2180096.1 phosphate ABC transporter substrate-binding protein [Aliiglaciecola sp. CAU 1673]